MRLSLRLSCAFLLMVSVVLWSAEPLTEREKYLKAYEHEKNGEYQKAEPL
ncbi:MAG: hypothetical protein U5N26_11825 [Candidatus Marinimicrobia bacterium]|nr:hypothetical protein [Candidatus Neomarinimicrobiota bacterium]